MEERYSRVPRVSGPKGNEDMQAANRDGPKGNGDMQAAKWTKGKWRYASSKARQREMEICKQQSVIEIAGRWRISISLCCLHISISHWALCCLHISIFLWSVKTREIAIVFFAYNFLKNNPI